MPAAVTAAGILGVAVLAAGCSGGAATGTSPASPSTRVPDSSAPAAGAWAVSARGARQASFSYTLRTGAKQRRVDIFDGAVGITVGSSPVLLTGVSVQPPGSAGVSVSRALVRPTSADPSADPAYDSIGLGRQRSALLRGARAAPGATLAADRTYELLVFLRAAIPMDGVARLAAITVNGTAAGRSVSLPVPQSVAAGSRVALGS